MNKYQIPRNEAIIIEKFILTIISTNKDLITYETDTLVFNEMDFGDVLYFHIFKDNIFFQYILSSKDQTDFKDTIKKIELNDNEIDIKKISKIKFENCSFINMMINDQSKIKEISFVQCEFDGEVSIQDNQNIKLLIEISTFNKYIQLQRSKFEKLEIKTSTFKNIVNFENCHFNGEINFENISFLDNVNFSMAKIKNELDLTKVFFKEEVNFLGIKQKDNKNLQSKNIANRETARIIKNSFEKQNNIIEANKFYALEMEQREKELDFKKNTLDWIVFKAHKISSNHSQDWFLTLLWILNISILYTHYQFYKLGNFDEYHTSLFLLNIISVFLIGVSSTKYEKTIWTIASYCIYSLMNNDFILCYVVNNLYFFTKGCDMLDTISFLYRGIIAYLIYQFIISIRQNTRRK